MKILLTGGFGFIGSAVLRQAVAASRHEIVTVDKMTYAASEEALAAARHSPCHVLLKQDICDVAAMRAAFAAHRPDAVMHLAAESHVDRSIDGPGTFVLLEASRAYFATLVPLSWHLPLRRL